MKKNVEILSPAGSFEAGVAAFEGGADAVYLGLSDFSARKSAKNFSKEELLSLKTLAEKTGKKIFVALNTIIKDSEMKGAIDAVAFLDEIKIDALILQDIGLVSVIKELFPDLELHASTQMAVHTVEGVRFLKSLGFSRVVLSREVPLEHIAKIKKAVPDMELEVFIHGALCYSFSGLCLASGMMLGRSGNRGMCAQLCRNYYEMDGRKGYFFSCNDLCLKDQLKQLAEAGVDSFKIEGRMKAPEYVYHTAKLYRTVLDNGDYFESFKNSRICFARAATTGYISHFSGVGLVGSTYPGHRGIKIGTCERISNGKFFIKTKYALGIRDGLLFFKNNDEKQPHNCAVEEINAANGKNLKTVGDSERVWLKTADLPSVGDDIYLTSSRALDMKKVNPGSFRKWKKSIPAEVSVNGGKILVRSGDFSYGSEEIGIEKSENQNNFIGKFGEIMNNSGDFFYFSDNAEFDGSCEYVFVVPSVLKKIRNDFYEKYSAYTEAETEKKINGFFDGSSVGKAEKVPEIFSRRALMNPDKEIPFFMESDSFESLKTVGGYVALPLLPLMKNSGKYLEKVNNMISEHSDTQFLVGLSNYGHFEFALANLNKDNVFFFVDFSLYAANRYSCGFFRKQLGSRLLFVYSWIEETEESEIADLPDVIPVIGFNPPLFVGAGCFERSNALKVCADCRGSRSERILRNGDKKFKVISQNCITFMFAVSD